MKLLGRLAGASNETFLVEEDGRRWVYKPQAGESPLWDFPEGTLSRREVAAWEIAQALDLPVVPETHWGEGPLGEGSFQWFVEGRISDLVDLIAPEELTEEWAPVVSGIDAQQRPIVLVHRYDDRLRAMALFDAIVNNADRKAGHILELDDAIYGVDHGVILHPQPKLRTVLWGFLHQPWTEQEQQILTRGTQLEPVAPGLDALEWRALRERCVALLDAGGFPAPSGEWPAIPWPPL